MNQIDQEFVPLEDKDISSQDHVWHLLVGLALIKELVDDEGTYKSLKGPAYYLDQWISEIAERLIRSMHTFDIRGDGWVDYCECHANFQWDAPIPIWSIRNPYNCNIETKSNEMSGEVFIRQNFIFLY